MVVNRELLTLAVLVGCLSNALGQACNATLLQGTWVGSCTMNAAQSATNVYNCSSGGCTQPYTIQYMSGFTRYLSSGSFTSGTSSCMTTSGANLTAAAQSTCSGATDVSGLNCTGTAYTATAGSSSADSFFLGTPCSVTVTGLGCYLAWTNGTYYQEEGNYILSSLSYVGYNSTPPTCPTCTDNALGKCNSNGSVTCDPVNSLVNYRCTAVRSTTVSTSGLVPPTSSTGLVSPTSSTSSAATSTGSASTSTASNANKAMNTTMGQTAPPTTSAGAAVPSQTFSPDYQCYVGVKDTFFPVPSNKSLQCGYATFKCANCSDPAVSLICSSIPPAMAGPIQMACTDADIKAGNWVTIYAAQDPIVCSLAATVLPMASNIFKNLKCCGTSLCNAPPLNVTTTPYTVVLQLALPYTLAEFTPTVQQTLREQLAVAAGMTKSDFTRVGLSYAAARRRLLAGIAVNATLNMPTADAARTAVSKLTIDAINTALAAGGLKPATLLSPASNGALSAAPGSARAPPLAALAALAAAAWAWAASRR